MPTLRENPKQPQQYQLRYTPGALHLDLVPEVLPALLRVMQPPAIERVTKDSLLPQERFIPLSRAIACGYGGTLHCRRHPHDPNWTRCSVDVPQIKSLDDASGRIGLRKAMASLSVVFELLNWHAKIPTRLTGQQRATIDALGIGPRPGSYGVSFSTSEDFARSARRRRQELFRAATKAMQEVGCRLSPYGLDRSSSLRYHDETSFIFECAGNAAGAYATDGLPPSDNAVVTYGSSNMDSPGQQLIVLVGLAVAWEFADS